MEGDDVAVLNGIVKSKTYGATVRFGSEFRNPTALAVRAFQRRVDLSPSGVVTRVTARELTKSMKHGGATWYGPGFYGHRTACGQLLRPGRSALPTRDFPAAPRSLSPITGIRRSRPVIDRGPYTEGNDWDLSNGLRQALHFGGSDQIRYAVAR